ncbi:MAG: hypothetical protein O2894_11170 [Planctomycetota bacterium]|nr:hypothetical protein [Planctomycetota bacterium]
MNRMALVCTLVAAAVTLAALADHTRSRNEPTELAQLPPDEETVLPTPVVLKAELVEAEPVEAVEAEPAPSVAASAPMPPAPTTQASIGELQRRITKLVLAPLDELLADRASFSRVRMPHESHRLRMEEKTVRAPKPDGRVFVQFEVQRVPGRASESDERPPVIVVRGRVDVTSGAIELALPNGGAKWEPADAVLASLGVGRERRPW